MNAQRFQPLRVAELRRDTVDALEIHFETPGAFAFQPGQYVTLRARIGGEEVRRPYSICSSVGGAGFSVGVKRVPGGVFSGFVHEHLKAGDVLEVMGPEGRFGTAVRPAAARTLLGIAAGSGITPVLSILRSVLEGEAASRFVLLYGSRSTAEIMFRGALEDLKDRYLERLSVVHVLSREAQDVALLHGRLDAARIGALLPGLVRPAEVDAAFLCGPEGVIVAAETALAAFGVGHGVVQAERFTPAVSAPARAEPMPAAAEGATATVIFDGKTNTIPLPPGQTILEAALAAGLDLPWSCRGGMCSTCRARLVEGAAAMDENFSLEPWETEAGYVLTCQARASTAHVTVDYDQV